MTCLEPWAGADRSEKELPAAQRRATYSGGIVQLGNGKPALCSGRPLERLALQTSLVRRLGFPERGRPHQQHTNVDGIAFDEGRPKDLAGVD